MSRWEGFKRTCSKITGGNILRWFWPLPSFEWQKLAFTDRLKLLAFFIQAGGGMAMTAFAAYAMYKLAQLEAVWPVFYLGAIAMVLIGIIITGLASLLIKRSVEMEVGPVKFKAADSETADKMVEAVQNFQPKG